jgi:hypothetical protein
MTLDEFEIKNEKQELLRDPIEDKPDSQVMKVLIPGMLAAFICAGLWVIISTIFKVQIGYMALGIGVGVGYTVRKVSKSNSEKLALVSAGISFLGWLFGTIITLPMFPLSIYDYLFCFLAIGEGFYFVAYSKLGPEIEIEEDELDILLREKDEKKKGLEKDKTDDDDEYESRRHNDPYRAKRIYEDIKTTRRGPFI